MQLAILNSWLISNLEKPDLKTKQLLMKKTGLTSKQIDNWFLYQLKK